MTHQIDLILMDIMMPEMDGITAMVKIREKCNVPVILLTAKSEDSDKILGLTVGADDYITKPFEPLEVAAKVRAHLRRAGAQTIATEEVENIIKQEGERAVLETGVHGLHPDIVKLIGKLKYRTSYGQNVLNHSIEVSNLARIMAEELGLDPKIARRAGLLHDIGKALDHDMEGTHVELGVEVLRKFKENELVINAVEAHHGDVEPKTLEAVLIQAADAISASRPGARRETLEAYIKRLQNLEEIANSFEGVDKSFAIQAGREVRIIVKPEKVSDADMTVLARDIAQKVENEMEYPGQIKVNVIRETRTIDYAK